MEQKNISYNFLILKILAFSATFPPTFSGQLIVTFDAFHTPNLRKMKGWLMCDVAKWRYPVVSSIVLDK